MRFSAWFTTFFMVALLACAHPAHAEETCQVRHNHVLIPGVTFTFTGQCIDGLVSGGGVIQWFSRGMPTVRETGRWAAGARVGPGITEYGNGDRFEGDFVAGAQTGKGVYLWLDGRRYEGDFVDGVMSGQGTLTGVNGDRYEGQFLKGLQTGEGEVVKTDGTHVHGAILELAAASIPREHSTIVSAVCPNSREINVIFPSRASKKGLSEGSVYVEFEVDGDTSSNFVVKRSSDSAFESAAIQAAQSLKCKSSEPVHLVLPVFFGQNR